MALLRRQQDVQEAFSRQLIESQEHERKRIAAGLHDGLSQNLILIKNWAVMGRNALAGDHAVRTRLAEIESVASQALSEVREVVHDLVPYQLERLGFGSTLSELVQKVGDSTGIRLIARVGELDGQLSKNAQINLFRVIQEAINNVVKHSGAASALVAMDIHGGTLHVKVQDDGCGFDMDAATSLRQGKGGVGLFGMSERMRMIGGHLSVASLPGSGTTIAVSLPLEGTGHGR